jgi:murein DD-endopeptidase MepM/ murein hydrolase activator NlpD
MPASEGSAVLALPADGFDYPVGPPDGRGYYLARGYRANGHLGEDWNGRGGGNTDLGDPVHAAAHGVVVFSKDQREGWGNVVIIRHAYRESSGRIDYVDTLYGHLDRRMVALHETVQRGQQIGTIGTNRGMYWAHLHFEIRKNLNIGMNRSEFARNGSNYHDPSSFIAHRRRLQTEMRPVRIPVDTYGEFANTFDDFLARMGAPATPPPAKSKPVAPPEPTAEEAAADEGEREKIRAFWDRLRAGSVTPGGSV